MASRKASSGRSRRSAKQPARGNTALTPREGPRKTAARLKAAGKTDRQVEPTAGSKPGKVNVFISYARDDHRVATALYEELIDINRDRVNCFLDSKTIDSGEGWEEKLEGALATADWLVCVYTGEQSEFCGYEIGVFTRGKALEKKNRNSRLVCLHDVANYPTVFRLHQNRFVEFPPEYVPPGQTFDETEFYGSSELAKFFVDFCKYEDLYVPSDSAGYERQKNVLIGKSKRVAEAFRASRGDDIRGDTPTQLGIEASFPWPPGQAVPSIPAGAHVKGTFQSFSLFGLMPHMEGEQLPTALWAEIKAAGRTGGGGYLPWVERLEKDMLDAANKRALGDAEATFRTKNKTFRAILVRHILHWNGSQRFGIVFVETLPRQFIGDQNTSLILAGLVMASRFRFAYFEDPERTTLRFNDSLSDQEFEASYRQFLYDLERMRQELMELGLLDDTSFVHSFGPSWRGMAETFLKTWYEARQELERGLPPPEDPIVPGNRESTQVAITQFLKTMEAENCQFLLAAVDAYRDELNAQLNRRAGRRGE